MTQYKLTEETKEYKGITLHRIELTQDCKWGKKGDKGGWIQSEKNLSEDAWIGGEACVYGNAHVYGDACVYDNAWVWGNVLVWGNAWVSGNACVYGYALVWGNAFVSDNARVYGFANISHDIILISGEWDTTPMYLQIPDGPTMNMSKPGILRIGGEHKSINDCSKMKHISTEALYGGLQNIMDSNQ